MPRCLNRCSGRVCSLHSSPPLHRTARRAVAIVDLFILPLVLTVVLIGGCNRGRPEIHVRPGETAPTDGSNTAINVRDAGGSTLTPFDQSNERSDIELVAAIRSRVVSSDGMSLLGRNVKIITNQGRVVLRGPVNSVEERERIVNIAEELAGATYVTDQLEVDRR